MSPSLLAAPLVTFKQGQADSVMNHPFWNKTWYLRHILLTVWCCSLKDSVLEARCRNIWNSQTRITYTCTYYKIMYPEDIRYVFVDWLNNPQVHQRPAFFSSVTRNTWRNYCIWTVSPRKFLSRTFILCSRNSIRLNQMEIGWLLIKIASLCNSLILSKGLADTSWKSWSPCLSQKKLPCQSHVWG